MQECNEGICTPPRSTRPPREELDLFIQTVECKGVNQVTGSDVADALRIVRDILDDLAMRGANTRATETLVVVEQPRP